MSSNPSFSQRIGISPLSKNIQLDTMDDDLRNSIWNLLDQFYFQSLGLLYKNISDHSSGQVLFSGIWNNFLKQRVDFLNFRTIRDCVTLTRNYFYDFTWNKVYDFVEFLITHHPIDTLSQFVSSCNVVLEREFSGYRIISNQITPITNQNEMNEVSQSLQTPLQEINTHFQRSLSLLSDKQNPDPRNSIKESISAVETLCKKIVGNNQTTLGAALNQIEAGGLISLHPDMNDAFKKFYNYTSDASGVRHALMDGKTPANFDDAKFMLVSCSAFVNYLIAKSNDAGIKLT